jgi:UDP-glucose 4-epimerase
MSKSDIIGQLFVNHGTKEAIMNIMVMGGSGLFGRKTAAYLLKDPEVKKVVSLDMAPPTEWFLKSIENDRDKFQFVRGDVSQLEDILNPMKQYAIDRVINWAFIMVTELQGEPRLVTKVNVIGMSNAFEAAKIMNVKRVVYASSETVYGPQAMYGMREVTEDDQTNPTHSYAVCKLYAEIMAGQYQRLYGMSFTGLRPTIGYGHGGRSPAQYWSDIPSAAAIGKPFAMEGDGQGLSSLVAADDVAEFTRILIKADASPHPVYNVGGPPQTPQDLATVVSKYIPDAIITFGEQPMMDKEGKTGLPWLVSGERAKKDFGFSCLSLEKAVLIHINDARLEAGLKPIKG